MHIVEKKENIFVAYWQSARKDYADFFRPFYEQETRFLVDFNEKIHEVIIRLIANDAKGEEAKRLLGENRTTDWQGMDLEPCFGNGQSILDILFEYGPESVMKIWI